MPRCEVRWKRNPHIERALLQFSTDIPKSRHLDTPRSISRDRQGLWKPRIRVARLLFPAAVAFSTCTRNLSPSSPSLFSPPPLLPLFQATLSSCPPFAPRHEIPSSEILDFWGRCFCYEKLSCRLVTKSRELPRILRAAIHGASFALFISFDRALQNLTSIGRLPMRDFGWYPLWFDWCSSWTRTSLRQ